MILRAWAPSTGSSRAEPIAAPAGIGLSWCKAVLDHGPRAATSGSWPIQVKATTASTKTVEPVTARLPATSTLVAKARGSRRPSPAATAAKINDTTRATRTAVVTRGWLRVRCQG